MRLGEHQLLCPDTKRQVRPHPGFERLPLHEPGICLRRQEIIKGIEHQRCRDAFRVLARACTSRLAECCRVGDDEGVGADQFIHAF